MVLLILSVLALFGGLLLMPLLRQHMRWVAALDGFVVVAVGGLVLIHLIPHSVELGGRGRWWRRGWGWSCRG